MAFQINKISETTRNKIKQKSVLTVPDNVSAKGINANQLKQIMAGIVVDKTFSALAETDRIIDEINEILGGQFVSKWHTGNIIEGTGVNILVLKCAFPSTVLTGDLYLNKITGNIYLCVETTLTESYWDYILNIKGIKFSEDNETTSITYTLEDNIDKTFSAENITEMNVVIPAIVYHGFCAGINFKSGNVAPSVEFTNNSEFPLKILVFGLSVASYTPNINKTVGISIFCDGINIYCYINEIA